MKGVLDFRRAHYLARLCISLIAASFIAGMAGCDGYNPPSASQNLEIRTWDDLDAIRNNLSGSHILMNDLDSTTAGYTELASPTADGGKGWQPVVIFHPHGPTAYTGFMGTFDGQGYDISGLFIDRPDEGYVGLFGAVEGGGVIQDISVVNLSVIGDYHVGGLVGKNDGTVINSYSSGNITGRSRVGGLSGGNTGTVSNSYSTCTVAGEWGVGGLVGDSEAVVSDSYSTGSVTGKEGVGGLLGGNEFDSTVSNCYSIGNVSGDEYVGGLVGGNSGSVNNSYSSGNVIGDVNVGGLLGENKFDGTVSNCFWDIQTSGLTTSAGGTGKTTAEMKDIATFSGTGWDICAVPSGATSPAYVWNIVDHETCPFLSWQQVSTPHSQEPIEIVSVLGPIGLPNPAGPIVEITLKNVAVEPAISLTATLEVSSASGIPFDFTFDDVSPSNPLQPDGIISNTRCLIGGGFTSNEWYFLKIHATLEDGAEFVYIEQVQIAEPS